MKDELNMLSAVCRDQKSVLQKVGENIAMTRTALQSRSGGKLCTDPQVPSIESSSAFSFQQQSDKHARHIGRMQDQANQAYKNVSVFST